MADIVNLYADSNRNIIGDDSTPTLTLENASTGQALKLQSATATTNAIGDIQAKSGCAATIAVLKVSASTASQAAFDFSGSCVVSTASGAATVYGAFRVKVGDKYGWVPFYEKVA